MGCRQRWAIGHRHVLACVLLMIGCAHENEKPQAVANVGQPIVSTVDPNTPDPGLPSYDLQTTADKMAISLLSDPNINADRQSWTLAVDHMDDNSAGSAFQHNYDVLLERLRAKLFQESNGRIQLIEKRATSHDASAPPAVGPAPPPREIEPDYVLAGRAMDLPHRGVDFFQLAFAITNSRTKARVWSGTYDVHAAR